MKRFVYTLLYFICFVQCTLITTTNTNYSDACEENLETYALSVRDVFYPELPTKTSETEILQYSYTYDDLHSSATVVEFGEKNGFVVMANNDNHTPLIVAKEGRFEEYINNPGMYPLIMESLTYEQPTSLDPDIPTTMLTLPVSVSTDTLMAPMVKVKWHQGAPFNMYAPNSVAGCTPIAIAQVMSYYKYPNELDITYPNATTRHTNLDWNDIIDHTGSHGDTCSICVQCGLLTRQIGHYCRASYAIGKTVAAPYVEFIRDLGYFGIHYDDYAFQPIIESINNNHPCIISGFRGNSGHTWIIDGYYERTTISNTYMVSGLTRELYRVTKDIDTYFHFNYGWGDGSEVYVLSNRIRHTSDEPFSGDGDVITNPITIFDNGFNDIMILVTNLKPLEE